MTLVNRMKLLESAFVSYWLGKMGPGIPPRMNDFFEKFDLGAIFFISLYMSKVLGSVLLLFKEVLIYGSIPHLRQEWNSRKHPCCLWNSFNEPLSKQMRSCLKTD